jgi:hypothetical protein
MLHVTKRNETPFQTYQFKKIIFKIQKIKCKTNNIEYKTEYEKSRYMTSPCTVLKRPLCSLCKM